MYPCSSEQTGADLTSHSPTPGEVHWRMLRPSGLCGCVWALFDPPKSAAQGSLSTSVRTIPIRGSATSCSETLELKRWYLIEFSLVFLGIIGWDSCHVHEGLLTYFSLVHTPHGGFILLEWKFHFFSLFFMFWCLFKFIQSYTTNRRDFVTSVCNVVSSISTERSEPGKKHFFSEHFLK